MTDRVSEWSKASGPPTCPRCGASNRPNATYLERQQDGSYLCIVCAACFRPDHA